MFSTFVLFSYEIHCVVFSRDRWYTRKIKKWQIKNRMLCTHTVTTLLYFFLLFIVWFLYSEGVVIWKPRSAAPLLRWLALSVEQYKSSMRQIFVFEGGWTINPLSLFCYHWTFLLASPCTAASDTVGSCERFWHNTGNFAISCVMPEENPIGGHCN